MEKLISTSSIKPSTQILLEILYTCQQKLCHITDNFLKDNNMYHTILHWAGIFNILLWFLSSRTCEGDVVHDLADEETALFFICGFIVHCTVQYVMSSCMYYRDYCIWGSYWICLATSAFMLIYVQYETWYLLKVVIYFNIWNCAK